MPEDKNLESSWSDGAAEDVIAGTGTELDIMRPLKCNLK